MPKDTQNGRQAHWALQWPLIYALHSCWPVPARSRIENTFDVDSFGASIGKCICKLLLHSTRLDLWPAIKSAFRLKLDGKMAKCEVNMAKAK